MDVSKSLNRPPNQWEDGTYIISNSEVATFLACQRRHYYAFLYEKHGLEPKQFSTALSRGIIGHQALNTLYNVLRETEDIDKARHAMILTVNEIAMEHNADIDMLGKLLSLLKDYCDFYLEEDLENWEILQVEKYYDAPLTVDFKYGMRLDLLVRDRYTGETILIDHKFVYDFYTANQLLIDAQIPKYLGTLMANGVRVHKGMINQLRHRTKKGPMEYEEKFQREYQPLNVTEIRKIMRDQIIVSEDISNRRNMPEEEAESIAVHNIHKQNCNNCAFLRICKTQLLGEPITLEAQTFYRPNSYGYRVDTDE